MKKFFDDRFRDRSGPFGESNTRKNIREAHFAMSRLNYDPKKSIHEVLAMIDPPRPLGERGLDLWYSILQNYEPDDAMDLELLYQACAAAERADELRASSA